MAIITISRGSYSRGKEVAEKVASRLGYRCVGRDMLLEASHQSHIPEIKLVRAIHDAPSILDRFTYRKEKYIAHVQAALARQASEGFLVYHGLAGHFFLRGISHVFKIRILADMSDRVALEMEREGISEQEARRILTRDDEERRKWSKYLYGIDTWDPSLYDMVLRIRKITVDDAVHIISRAACLDTFDVTAESRKAMDDLLLASEVKVRLVDLRPDIEVYADGGTVFVQTKVSASTEQRLVQKIKTIAATVEGVNDVQVKAEWPSPYA